MRAKTIILHSAQNHDPTDPESQLWPVTCILLIASGFLAGAIIARCDFQDQRLLYNGWTLLGVLAFSVGLMLWGAIRLRGRVLMRVQVALLLSLLIHVLHIGAAREVYFAFFQEKAKSAQPRPNPPNDVTLPLYPESVFDENPDPASMKKPVETPLEEQKQTLPERTEPTPPPTPTQKPAEQPPPSTSIDPQPQDLKRPETSAPKSGEMGGQRPSRQTHRFENPNTQAVPAPQAPTQSQSAAAPALSTDIPLVRQTQAAATRPRAQVSPQPAGESSPRPQLQAQPRERSPQGEPQPAEQVAQVNPTRTPRSATAQNTAVQAAPPALAQVPSPSAPAPSSPQENTTSAQVSRQAAAAVAQRPSSTTAPATTAATVAQTATQARRESVVGAPAQTPQPSALARSQGESRPVPSQIEATTPAISEAPPGNQPAVESATVSVTRSQPGAGGATIARNFAQTEAGTPSTNLTASAAAQRAQASQTDPAANAAAPSRPATIARSTAGAETPQAALAAQQVTLPDAAGSVRPANVEASSSAAVSRQASRAPPGKVQAAAGSGALDLSTPQVVGPAGQDRGAAARGSGEPALAQSSQNPRLGKATAAGEASAAAATATIGPVAISPGSREAGLPGPQVESSTAVAARQAAPAPATQPSTGTGATGSPSASATLPNATARASGEGSALDPTSAAAGPGVPRVTRAPSLTGAVPGGAPTGVAQAEVVGNGDAPGATEPQVGGLTRRTAPPGPAGGAAGSPSLTSEVAVGALPGRRDPGEAETGAERSGDDPLTGLPRKQLGVAGLPSGLAQADSAGQSAPEEGPTAGGLAEGPGLEVARQAAGLPVQIAAAPGPGGLTNAPHLEVGIYSPSAQQRSDQVSLAQARLILDRSLGRPNLPGDSQADMAPAFMLRQPDVREQVAEKLGGSPESERAVEMGLDYLARMQMPDGSWRLHPPAERTPAAAAAPRADGLQADTGATGLVLLTFLGAGYDHQRGKYQDTVTRGLDWMIQHQQPSGELHVGGSLGTRYYSHAIASIALNEAHAMTRDPRLREPARRALQFLLDSRDPRDGGWRYQPNRETDTSVTGWGLMALKSGEISGFPIPAEAYQGITKWLDFAQAPGDGSRYAYLPKVNARSNEHKRPNEVMTAEALLMRMYLGWNRENPNVREGADYLQEHLPPENMLVSGWRDSYYWYYATQVMYQIQGPHWQQWNQRIRPLLINSQVRSGADMGSWDPRRDRWGVQYGRIYVTAMHLLILEVYYRHLPLYRWNETPNATGN